MKFGKLEFGNHGIEGLKKETDEHLIDDDTLQGDGHEIADLLADIDKSMDEDEIDIDEEKKEENDKEQEEKDSFHDNLKKQNKEIEDEDEAKEYLDYYEKSQKEIENLNKNIEDIFG